jgi:hypothetical protein
VRYKERVSNFWRLTFLNFKKKRNEISLVKKMVKNFTGEKDGEKFHWLKKMVKNFTGEKDGEKVKVGGLKK